MFVNPSFAFTFIVHAVKSDYALEKHVQFRVRSWIFGDFKERLENVCGVRLLENQVTV